MVPSVPSDKQLPVAKVCERVGAAIRLTSSGDRPWRLPWVNCASDRSFANGHAVGKLEPETEAQSVAASDGQHACQRGTLEANELGKEALKPWREASHRPSGLPTGEGPPVSAAWDQSHSPEAAASHRAHEFHSHARPTVVLLLRSAERFNACCGLPSPGSAARRMIFPGTFELANGGPGGCLARQVKERSEVEGL